ncbi:MAG TPA: phosphate signaling complex protein PhoU [Bacteroidales bacterium]|nr:phosphate signaling complex protein PhoU [Bacteroidales bacterium]HPS63361.1 phosphate signaling complex protein PhoU [Bacteroidales bacterium]
MERHFEQELEKLNRRLLKMGSLVYDQVHRSLEALLAGDIELAAQVISLDNKVDKLDVKIDKLCQRIFALTQPVATDLRLIMSALKMNNDLERIGDLAVNIAEKVEGVSEYREILSQHHIDDLIGMTDLIVRDVVNILQNRNSAFVKDIFTSAAAIEEKVLTIKARILDEMMHKSEVIVVATHLVIILTHIDRIAGYATNIAESIFFVVEGRMIKHKKDEII